jgi:hypothetical protein
MLAEETSDGTLDMVGKPRLDLEWTRLEMLRTLHEQSTTAQQPTPNMSAAAPAPSQDVKRKAAREVIDILHEIATLLVRAAS